jgi:hypothetical protein
MSNWSDIINVTFPDELLKDTSISKIIQENNTDFENNRVANILKEEGIKDHVVDAVLDQNITYFHKPESIASGFLTDERRIIPLKDKLQSMSNDIALLKSELSGTETNVSLSAVVGSVLTPLLTDQDNIIILNAFDDLVSQTPSDLKDGQSTTLGCYEVSKNGEDNNCSHKISTLINLNISNTTNGTIKLYSIMPGNRDTTINDVINTRVDKNGYIITSDDKTGGVHYDWIGRKNEITLQKCNQFVTFRARDLWTGNPYYGTDKDEVIAPDKMLQTAVEIPSLTYGKTSMTLYPYLSNKYGISLDNDEVKTYKVLNPNSEIVVPIKCEFQFGTETVNEIVKYISFDIKTSLYKDPVNYTIKVIVKRRSTVEDKMYNKNTTYNSVKYNIVTPK